MTIGIVVALAVATSSAPFVPWQLWLPLGWICGSGLVLAWTWKDIVALDETATRTLATREDDSRFAVRSLLVGSSSASLLAVMTALFEASRTSGTLEVALTATGLATVVVSWLTIQTVFALRYAHSYYDEPVGGICFPGGEQPDYRDFAYLSFTVGMTFQVSDTNIESRTVRRLIVGQALLAYIFATAIVAIAINLVAGIIS